MVVELSKAAEVAEVLDGLLDEVLEGTHKGIVHLLLQADAIALG